MRRAFRLAFRGGALASIPRVPMLNEHNARQDFFERSEFDTILAHLPDYLRSPLEFMYVTGWRKSEVFSLTTTQVDLTARVVRRDVGTTKSGEGRTFVLTDALRC
jgi:integrase